MNYSIKINQLSVLRAELRELTQSKHDLKNNLLSFVKSNKYLNYSEKSMLIQLNVDKGYWGIDDREIHTLSRMAISLSEVVTLAPRGFIIYPYGKRERIIKTFFNFDKNIEKTNYKDKIVPYGSFITLPHRAELLNIESYSTHLVTFLKLFDDTEGQKGKWISDLSEDFHRAEAMDSELKTVSSKLYRTESLIKYIVDSIAQDLVVDTEFNSLINGKMKQKINHTKVKAFFSREDPAKSLLELLGGDEVNSENILKALS